MARGMLTFNGTIDLTQFWPQSVKAGNTSDSDADTVKVKAVPHSAHFTSPTGKAQMTDFLDKAGFFHNVKSKGGAKTLKFKPVMNAKGEVDMRLQGIDAPELHYMTQIFGNPLFRQLMGETSTVQFFNFLKSHAKGNNIQCKIFTQVNKPNDVFDKFGRCVGDILIQDKNQKFLNVNQWLVENGWTFPAYYNSMTNAEINAIDVLAVKAMKKKLNIWQFLSQKMTELDKKLIHNKKDGTYSVAKDRKPPVIFSKLFHRHWTFQIKNQKKFSTAGYQKFVLAQKIDTCCLTSDFLKRGFPKKPPLLGSFLAPNGVIKFKPADIVFHEAPSTVKDAKRKFLTTF